MRDRVWVPWNYEAMDELGRCVDKICKDLSTLGVRVSEVHPFAVIEPPATCARIRVRLGDLGDVNVALSLMMEMKPRAVLVDQDDDRVVCHVIGDTWTEVVLLTTLGAVDVPDGVRARIAELVEHAVRDVPLGKHADRYDIARSVRDDLVGSFDDEHRSDIRWSVQCAAFEASAVLAERHALEIEDRAEELAAQVWDEHGPIRWSKRVDVVVQALTLLDPTCFTPQAAVPVLGEVERLCREVQARNTSS